MLVDTTKLKAFMMTEGQSFPYNDLRVTRKALHPKWLLLESANTGSFCRTRNFFVIPSSSLPKATVQALIIEKAVMPLPLDFSEVVDYMETWGRDLSFRWEQEVLNLMANRYLRKGRNPGRKQLYLDCITILVKQKVYSITYLLDEVRTLLMEGFTNYFHTMYAFDTYDYSSLTIRSTEWVDQVVGYVQNTMEATTYTNVVTPEHSQSSTY